jgi:hypothetical protein
VADEQVIKILEEVRDLQKEHLASYKEAVKNQQESLDLQKRALRRQKITMAVYVLFMLALLGFWLGLHCLIRARKFKLRHYRRDARLESAHARM